MQETADSLSSRKFFCDAKYNEGWYKSESIFLQKKDRLSFVPTFIILGVQKNFWLELESAAPCIQEVSTLYSLGSGKRAGSTDLLI